MLKIECSEKDAKDNKSHVEVTFQLKADSKQQIIDEVAAISTMYQQIPRDLFLDGVCDSDLGKDALKEVEDF